MSARAWTVEDHLADKPDEIVALYRRFIALVDECGPKGYKQVSISGRELREKLRAGVLPDARVMRPETAQILIERMGAKA